MRVKSATARRVVAEAAVERTRLEEAVAVDGAHARREQPVDRGVGVVGSVHAVREVEDGGDAGLERLDRAGMVADPHVVGRVRGDARSRIPLK